MKSAFAILTSRTWVVDTPDSPRKEVLLKRVSYEEVVKQLIANATIESISREGFHADPGYYRLVVALNVRPDIVNLFHNSCSGYRAQYYSSLREGRRANKYAIDGLMPKIDVFLQTNPKITCPYYWCLYSLLDDDSKIWVCEGLWWYYQRRTDQIIKPYRWRRNLEIETNPEARDKMYWGRLAPTTESRIVINGAWYNLGLQKSKLRPKNRDQEIYDWGYT